MKYLFLVLFVLLSGCSSTFEIKSDDALKDKEPVAAKPSEHDAVNAALIDSANEVSRSLRMLAEVNNAEKNKSLTSEDIRVANWKAQYVPEGMGRKVDIEWVGSPEPLLEMISSLSDYQLRLVGLPSPIDHIVKIDAKQESIIDIIRDVSYQVKEYVEINVYTEAKTIEMKYVNR